LAADTGASQAVLDQITVVALPLDVPDRDLWVAVSSGSAVYELPLEYARHVAGVYERLSDDALVELARLPLESEPTEAYLEVLPAQSEEGYPAWVAVAGVVGAHSGTFELLRFDGITLTSVLWWFSPGPAAGTLEDLDGDGRPEVILDASDPYVFCYACGVTAAAEIVYRWVGPEPEAVNLVAVEGDPTTAALTAAAVAYVEADLWQAAQETIASAIGAAPGNTDISWLQIAIDRVAAARLAQAGADAQPLVTNVLAGEYDAAVDLMRPLDPAEVFDPFGPLLAGTAAEGWESLAGEYLADYATRALIVEPDLASAYIVRAVGRMLIDGNAWAVALIDIDDALDIAPGDAFYQALAEYAAEQNGGARG